MLPPRSPLEARRSHALDAFRAANPNYWNKVQGDPERARQVAATLERVNAVRARMEQHLSWHSLTWTDREVADMMDKRSAPNLKHPAPSWAKGVDDQRLLREEATRRVMARTEARLRRLEETGQRIARRIAQGREPVQRQNRSLKEEVHETVRRAQILRADCVRHFALNKSQWIDKARAQGSPTPESDVYRRQAQRMARLDRAERNRMHEVLQKHGVEHKRGRTSPDRSGPSLSR